ncbi:MAG TPA: Crp/Fnr family transcriptional regulator [Rhodocyclaceae bacterium]|jgi:CRP/FNR family transcriptional regulator|nr:Crp/Fnr family transcriptional regulator [Rhodocyclaceae bacterium]HMV20972.1 Crp/Fnr family transcriptional regulator [Rhodocyclaceae bacterium]HMW78165.1 Crp/Fnr family transcriptional regulator [Rhodocyclaceae bacterium]HNE43579.1 Crp/Fnr family transcriptional regulator [Rhodocyclaceae bacterium]HNM21319.1 Crp/Fnr family transcriptional regulator [Rhodocyclaceae bacterium]
MTPTADRAALLSLYPALAAVPASDLAPLLAPGAVAEVPAGCELFAERHPCRGFPLILAGSIKVVKNSPGGREMVLYRVEPGGSCIITSSCLLGHADYNARGIAESPLQLLVIPSALFARLVADQAPFRDFVFHLFSERLAELMQLVEEVAFARLDRRLAKLLLARGEDVIAVTHQHLAEELGSVREIVSRLLKGFAAQGLVSLGREQIILQDREGLRALAAL